MLSSLRCGRFACIIELIAHFSGQKIPGRLWLCHQAGLAKSNLAQNLGAILSDPSLPFWHHFDWTGSSNLQVETQNMFHDEFDMFQCVPNSGEVQRRTHKWKGCSR